MLESAGTQMTAGPLSENERAGVYRAIAERRDVRNYRPDPVPPEVLWRVLRAAHQAPSVGLMQPWDFVLVRDRSVRQSIYDHFLDVNARAASEHRGDRGDRYRALKLQGILDAPENLLVTCDPARGGPHVLGRHTMRHMDEYSTCLAVQNLWLAARAEGLGVGWMSLFEPAFMAARLGLPEGVLPVAYLTLGYPVEFPAEPLLESTGWAARRPLEQAVFLDRHGALAPAAEHARAEAPGQSPRPEPSAEAASADRRAPARARQAALTKPPGSLGRLETLAVDLAALQHAEHPACRAPCLLLFAGDHGVAEHGVSAWLSRTTALMVYQYLSGAGAVNVLCRQHGVRLVVTDVGVDHDFEGASGLVDRKVRRGTRDFLREPAMTPEELAAALRVGADLVVSQPQSDVLGLGEVGIANTTSSAALFAALAGVAPESVVGLGTGISAQTLERKLEVVRRAVALHRAADPTELLRRLGGLEIAALVGAIEAGARSGRLIVLDGFITAVAAVVASEREPAVKSHLAGGHIVASHAGREPGHRRALAQLGLAPLLDLELRLGEGSGAVLGISLIQSAVRLMREMRTFEEANLARPLDPRDAAGAGSPRAAG